VFGGEDKKMRGRTDADKGKKEHSGIKSTKFFHIPRIGKGDILV